jgi:heat-inducible transcriptional repressor
MENYESTNYDNIEIDEKLLSGELILSKIYESVTKKLTKVSGYASVMLMPKPDFAVVKRIELIPADNNNVLMLVIARTGMVVTRKFSLSGNVTLDLLRDYSGYLTAALSGYSISDIKKGMFDKLREEKITGFNVGMAVDMAELGLEIDEDSDFKMEGLENLLRIPEMTQKDTLAGLLNIIEEKNILKSIFESTMENESIKTMIGDEIDDSKVKGCSIVAAPYKIGNTNVGVVGVVGPTRMDYEKVVPVVDYTCKVISELLTEMSK